VRKERLNLRPKEVHRRQDEITFQFRGILDNFNELGMLLDCINDGRLFQKFMIESIGVIPKNIKIKERWMSIMKTQAKFQKKCFHH